MSDTNQINGRTFGQVIRERRILLALTHEELANRLQTSTPYVGHLEADKRYPSPKILSRLSEVLGLDLSDWRELYKRIGITM
jgi:transcriptional regulator with XRE-family HTH domain